MASRDFGAVWCDFVLHFLLRICLPWRSTEKWCLCFHVCNICWCVFLHSRHKRDLSYIFFMNECLLQSVWHIIDDWDSSKELSCCFLFVTYTEHQVECVRAWCLFVFFLYFLPVFPLFCFWRRGICVEVKRCVERRCLRDRAWGTELGFISHAIPHPDLTWSFYLSLIEVFFNRATFLCCFSLSITFLKYKFALCSSVLPLCAGSSSYWLCTIIVGAQPS